MKPRTYSSEAVVLARKNYSEADRILVVYTRDYGKISLVAKGVRKTKSRKRGSLEIFSQMKFSAARGKNIDLVTEVELSNSFPTIRQDLKKVSVAYFLMETVGRLTREEEKNETYFDYLVKSLKDLQNTSRTGDLRRKFIYDSLVILGFWPKGREMIDPDRILEEVTERKFVTKRVGKKILD